MSRLVIGAVFEKDAQTPKEPHQHLIGRTGKIAYIENNCPLYFEYDNNPELEGKCLRTSWVERYDQDDGGVWVYTKNSVYRFDNM